MPDEKGAGAAVEEKDEESPEVPGLSKKALKQLAKYAAQYATEAAVENESKQVDPATRPTFQPSPDEDSRVEIPENLKGLFPSSTIGAMPEVKNELARQVNRDLAVKDFAQNRFPRDMDAKDFCMSRYCMAVEQWKHGLVGEAAFNKFAPREHQYYQALSHYGKEYKALGEYVSGQDGGFLAPEIWTNTFYDMLYPSQVMSRLPITRMNMGGRVTDSAAA